MERFMKLKALVVLLFFYSSACLLNADAQPSSDVPSTTEENILKKIEKTYNVKQDGNLTVISEFGAIDVQTAEQNKVETVITFSPANSGPVNIVGNNNVVIQSNNNRGNVVIINGKVQNGSKFKPDPQVQKAIEDFEVTFEHKGSDVRINGKFKRGRKYWRNELNQLKILFRVTVPRQYSVGLETSSGGISVGDLSGNIQAQASAGSLRFGKIQGSIRGKTSAGSIRIARCNGNTDVQTSSGSIRLESVAGTVNARTSSGSIRASLTGQPKGECDLHTSAGSITVTLRPDIAINLDAKTSAGRVSTDFSVASVIQRGILKNRLRGSINGGGPLLKLRTSAGSIRLQKAAN